MLDFIPVALKNVFSKPATRNYPFEKREPFAKQRGHIGIDIDNCIYCGMCSRKCPAGAIKVDRVQRSWTIDRFKCLVCGACAESCPKKCLSIGGEYTPPSNVKHTDSFIGKPAPAPVPKPAVQKPAAPISKFAAEAAAAQSEGAAAAGTRNA